MLTDSNEADKFRQEICRLPSLQNLYSAAASIVSGKHRNRQISTRNSSILFCSFSSTLCLIKTVVLSFVENRFQPPIAKIDRFQKEICRFLFVYLSFSASFSSSHDRTRGIQEIIRFRRKACVIVAYKCATFLYVRTLYRRMLFLTFHREALT